ncbi:hypothetical protein GU334_05515 [Lactococcus raffinolactis]|uniref:Uncharacterized protein n=1 Tax=Pseudolactococcus raffinolactis TaxID=1366 RepID=A0AAE6YLT6_9LACT|nr:hypothetical protein [Lactococcus raffinolactis]QIW58395.1 hypothetical protein GU334_05515 [Lactococcus raffinolactis]
MISKLSQEEISRFKRHLVATVNNLIDRSFLDYISDGEAYAEEFEHNVQSYVDAYGLKAAFDYWNNIPSGESINADTSWYDGSEFISIENYVENILYSEICIREFASDDYMEYLDGNLDEFMEIAKVTIRTYFG